ncbi:phage tail assembly chaperone [Stappia sp. ES.058]|uniref:phage tail assembly chaperone n=1 Tax=Stappia sp. ES.058 TaxID=1881061 RepID=UPI00087A2E3F|nr:phage tail assembly chaperone [Stappia sp. ES.058]SDT99049.1 phage conserved hypothetical protein [Stappia sp. ES.058]
MNAAGGAPPAAFPWADVLRVCFVTLGWPPHVVWSATPREIAAALGPRARKSARALSRDGLETLMRRFPDGDTP